MSNTPLVVHHLGCSQSERIVWLCEELELEYQLKRYERRTDNKLAPPEYAALHPIGAAPVITDGELVLAESGAICEYLTQARGGARLAIQSTEPAFADYLYWLHFANGTLQPTVLRVRALEVVAAPDHPVLLATQARLERMLGHLGSRLASVPYLAGHAFTLADIMTVFSLTTMRRFRPYDLAGWPSILNYLQRIGARPAYRRAMAKADPGLEPVLGAKP